MTKVIIGDHSHYHGYGNKSGMFSAATFYARFNTNMLVVVLRKN